MKLGVLYPRSKEHPGMMADFMDGLKASLHHHKLNNKVQLISEAIGFGGIEKEVYEKAEKFLVMEGVDILIAFTDLRVLDILKPLMTSSGKLLLAVNPGANYPQNWIAQPNILNLTLQHSFLCWLSGRQASEMNKKNAAMVTTFYDCGYLHTAAMVNSFVKEGGTITYNHVNNQGYDDAFDIKPLTDFLLSDKETDCLLCVFDSLPASLFYSRLNAYAEAGNLSVIVSPMMLEESALEKMTDGFMFSVNGYLPWHSSLGNNANKEFMGSYLQQTKRDANIFSLLGWENGQIINEIFLHSNEKYDEGALIALKLAEGKINSPRGGLKLDSETNYFLSPVCKCSIRQNLATPLIEWMEIPEKQWAMFVKTSAPGPSSGWTNTYLCY